MVEQTPQRANLPAGAAAGMRSLRPQAGQNAGRVSDMARIVALQVVDARACTWLALAGSDPNGYAFTVLGGPAMSNRPLLNRITANPAIFGGKPVIRGLRISVESILGRLARGETAPDLLADFPELVIEDIHACLAYAHAVIANDSLDAVERHVA